MDHIVSSRDRPEHDHDLVTDARPLVPVHERRRWPWIAGGVAGTGALVVAGLLLGGGSSTDMHGTLSVTTWGGASDFCDSPSGTDPGPGAQVTVTAPSGDVIGTGELGPNPETSTQTLIGCVEAVMVYKFNVTGLPGEPRYGVQVAGLDGTLWYKPGELSHVNLTSGG